MTLTPCVKCGSTDRYEPVKGRSIGVCRPCTLAQRKKWRVENKEKVKESNRKHREKDPEAHLKYARDWYGAHQEAIQERRKERYKANPHPVRTAAAKEKAKHPEKNIARRKVRDAIAKEILPKPTVLSCADCGSKAYEYHHESYALHHRLIVIALCRKCHKKRHKKVSILLTRT